MTLFQVIFVGPAYLQNICSERKAVFFSCVMSATLDSSSAEERLCPWLKRERTQLPFASPSGSLPGSSLEESATSVKWRTEHCVCSGGGMEEGHPLGHMAGIGSTWK